MRRTLLVLLSVTFAISIGFIITIVGNLGNGIDLHEVAGTVLLILLTLALWASYRLRAIDERPMFRVVIAIAALVLAGVTGASLAIGTVSGALAGLPLVPLLVMLGAVADGIRISWYLGNPAERMDGESGHMDKP
ncbi:MAG: hypothetical protein WA688_04435 [Thermoplasmata archaeon]